MWRTDPFIDNEKYHLVKRPWNESEDIEIAAKKSIKDIETVLEKNHNNILNNIVQILRGF